MAEGEQDPDAFDDDIVGQGFRVPWAKRRWLLFAILAWAMGEITYIVHGISDPAELAQKAFIAQALIALVTALALGYFGFAVQDDRSRRAAVVSYAARVSPSAVRPPPGRTGVVDDPDA